MKKIFCILFSAMAVSCSFLNVVPDGTPTMDDIFSSSLQTERYLNEIYNLMPNSVDYLYMPDMCAGGDIITGTRGQTYHFPYKGMLYGEENANNTYWGLWVNATAERSRSANYDLYKGIRYAWNLIDNIDRVPNMTSAERSSMVGECYFLIGYFHWILMEHYGPVVVVDHEISINAGEEEVFAPRSSWDACSAFVCGCFDEAASRLPATLPRSQLGRATAVAAKAYKARVLMYSASPMVNGNKAYASFLNYDGTPLIAQQYDKEKWKTARSAVQDAIDLAEKNGCSLYHYAPAASESAASRGRQNYYYNFLQTWNEQEYLFAFADQTGVHNIQWNAAVRQWDWNPSKNNYTTQGYLGYLVPTLQLVETFFTANGLPLWDDPATKDAYTANRCLSYDADGVADLHKNRDPRFYATIGYDRGTYIFNGVSDRVLKLRKDEAHGYTGNLSHEYFSCTGYVLQKWVSISTTWDETTQSRSVAKYAFPYFRLAELYLDYAEADFEYDGALSATALDYLNKVRERAGLPRFQDSWALAGGIPSGDKLRSVLHQETRAELCCEGRWYHDLRRWGEAKDMLGTSPEVLNIEGSTADTFYRIVRMQESGTRVYEDPKTNWLAVPMSEMNINFRLVQNPGY